MPCKRIWCQIGEYPRRNLFEFFGALRPNNMALNYIDVNGVYITPRGTFKYLSDVKVSDGFIAHNVIHIDGSGMMLDFTESYKQLSRYETSDGYDTLYLLEEE